MDVIPFSVTCTGAGTASVDIASVSDTLARRRKKFLTLWRERGGRERQGQGSKIRFVLTQWPQFSIAQIPAPHFWMWLLFFFPCMLHSIARRFSKKWANDFKTPCWQSGAHKSGVKSPANVPADEQSGVRPCSCIRCQHPTCQAREVPVTDKILLAY